MKLKKREIYKRRMMPLGFTAYLSDDNHHRHPLRLAEHEIRYAGHLAIRYESEMAGVATWLPKHLQRPKDSGEMYTQQNQR